MPQCYYIFFGNGIYYCGKNSMYTCPCDSFVSPGLGSDHQEPKSENVIYRSELPKPKKRYL